MQYISHRAKIKVSAGLGSPWRLRGESISIPFPGFSRGSDGKESACRAGDLDLIPRWGRLPGKGNGNPLQYSCLGNPMDRGDWWGPWGHKELDMTKQLTHCLFQLLEASQSLAQGPFLPLNRECSLYTATV